MKIKERRDKLGVSQTRLARLARVSRYKIALYELGDGELAPEELERVDAALRQEAARIRSAAEQIERTAVC